MLYQRYSGKLLMVCLRYTKTKADAEDILQEGFIKIFGNLHQYTQKGSFEGWMKMIMVNTALESIRKKQFVFSDVTESEIQEQQVSAYSPLNELALKELLVLIQELPVGCQVVFNLYVIEGFIHADIAKRLNITEGTSKSQLARARKLLQEKIFFLTTQNNNKLSNINGRKELI